MDIQVSIEWDAQTKDGKRYKGTMPPVNADSSLSDIEVRLFEELNKKSIDATKATILVTMPDGSGKAVAYDKVGKMWVRVFVDTFLPRWSVYTLIGMSLGTLALIVFMWFLFTG